MRRNSSARSALAVVTLASHPGRVRDRRRPYRWRRRRRRVRVRPTEPVSPPRPSPTDRLRPLRLRSTGGQTRHRRPAPSTPPAPPAGDNQRPRLSRRHRPFRHRPLHRRSSGAGRAGRGRNIVLNFDNADIETVIQAASEIVGFNYVLAPDVRGKVTVQTAGRIPQEDVLGVLLAILEVHGFTAVKSGNLYKIDQDRGGARSARFPPSWGPRPKAARPDDEIITQIVSVRYASAIDLTTLLRPMISARGSLAAHRETNILIVTDTVANVRRLLDIVRLVDVEVALEELQIIPIRFADANDLAAILNQLYQSGRVRPGGAPGPAVVAPPTPAAPGAPGAAAPRPAGPATAEATGVERAPFIIAERRSNSLVIHARKRDIETIKRLIEQLDQNIYSGRRVFIYYAENAKSRDLAATLNSIYGSGPTHDHVDADHPGAHVFLWARWSPTSASGAVAPVGSGGTGSSAPRGGLRHGRRGGRPGGPGSFHRR